MTENIKQLVLRYNGKMVPLPNNLTNVVQPFDLKVNRSCNAFLCYEAQNWFAEQAQQQIQNGCEPEYKSK